MTLSGNEECIFLVPAGFLNVIDSKHIISKVCSELWYFFEIWGFGGTKAVKYQSPLR